MRYIIPILLSFFLFIPLYSQNTPYPSDVPIDPYNQPDPTDTPTGEGILPPDELPDEPPKAPDPPPPPPEFFGEEFPVKESLVYVIDRSGSMSQWLLYPELSRLEKAQKELVESIENLSDNYKFNVVAYNCSVIQVWPSLKKATDANKNSAIGWVQSLIPSGRTGTGPATIVALEMNPDHVILLTDGYPNCPYGIDEHLQMIVSNAGDIPVSTIGISDEGRFAQFLRDVASNTGGSYQHID